MFGLFCFDYIHYYNKSAKGSLLLLLFWLVSVGLLLDLAALGGGCNAGNPPVGGGEEIGVVEDEPACI